MIASCATCKFYVADSRPEYRDKSGTCKRYPPQLVWVTSALADGNFAQERPYMDKDDVCGEWTRR